MTGKMKLFLMCSLFFCNCLAFSPTGWGAESSVTFRDGGAIQGVTVSSVGNQSVLELPAGGKLVFGGSAISQVTPLSSEWVRYRNEATFSSDDIPRHLEWATWCNQNKLPELGKRHLERILELDPENAEAHKRLGHIQEGDVWIGQTHRERLEQKGYVRSGGQTVTLQEQELERLRAGMKSQEATLKKEIKDLCKKYLDGDNTAADLLRQFREPIAYPPLAEAYKNEKKPELREVLVQAIAAVGTPAALMELGSISLNDPNEAVRIAAVDSIKKKPTAVRPAVEYYKRFLLDEDNNRVNLAAVALVRLEDVSALPWLINAITTEHKEVITTGSDQTGGTFSSNGNFSFNPGGGAQKKIVTHRINNASVLEAVRYLASLHYKAPVDFHYDVVAWRNWYRETQGTRTFSSRRDW